ncbi:MAG: DUF4388 domain-containing protein [Candidatus Competibacteraceae bacterium]|nr:DUF4388 domain-containing protein [Candidatus Competibacteraceae bacterium]MBK7984137.1 DUF4388 domain-containing protein [Candidatus Competibacteraceae bacterium]MBK8896112.1 DUF4388 domain-containing protein [Candidatus Competibacteraceae bacterium]MBK8964270.1 DUF4388 domain-containing protein [Candidatus Competibacteraceae bacterium]MBK9950365.1 DUF4388 domain-containing protein [Candidatus Competibacteraceae bacterium]
MFQKSLSLSAITAQLRNLCQEKKTGTLYLLESGRSLGQINLRGGEIISCWAQKQRGVDALPLLTSVKNGSIAFVQGTPPPTQMTLPSTAEILAAFEAADPAAAPAPPDKKPLDLPQIAQPDPPSQLSRARLGKNFLESSLLTRADPPSQLSTARADPPSQLSRARLGKNSLESTLLARADPPSQRSKANVGKNPLNYPLTAASKTIVEQTLREFIGPIAKMICTECFRFAITVDIAVDTLSKEIPNPQAAIQFRERILQRLG